MFRFRLVILAALLLGILSVPSASAAALLMEESPQKTQETLQPMFLEGADIYSDTTQDQIVLDTAKCGILLTYTGKQDGKWFSVSMGDVKGFVDGNYVTFDKKHDYCLAYFPTQPSGESVPASTQSYGASTPSGGGSYADTVARAAAYYGADFNWLWAVAGCESGYRFEVWGAAGEYGPFQFMESTYYLFASLSGYGGNWMNPVDQAYVAAWAFANGKASHWACA
jgi:hypothetical protein